jgi:Protein of unknown function (DUF3667)
MTADPATPDAAAAATKVSTTPSIKKGPRACENCKTELLGETCYQCGQPTKGLVRQFSSIMGDFFDTVLNIDTRVFRTLGPLVIKPGFLTYEYFSGRRVRYVSPVRLFFFLAVLTFLLAQFSLPDNLGDGVGEQGGLVQVDTDSNVNFGKLKTVAEVETLRATALQDLNNGQKELANVPLAGTAFDKAKQRINEKADKRIADIKKLGIDPSTRDGSSSPRFGVSANNKGVNYDTNDGGIYLNGERWHAKNNPVKVGWLPDGINTWLNSLAQKAESNGGKIEKDPALIIKAIFSALPMTLFIVLPIFALLLKLMYIGKRRLYMEHLIVALHSHAFLMVGIMLMILFGDISGWLSPESWLQGPLTFLSIITGFWMPIYLFIMQKRVYQQNWFVTLIKYFIIGNIHFILMTLAFTVTVLVKFIWL